MHLPSARASLGVKREILPGNQEFYLIIQRFHQSWIRKGESDMHLHLINLF